MNNIQKFNQLHAANEILFLGNAWDLLSALALEKAGFQAIGTTNWGMANSLGATDGEQIDLKGQLGLREVEEHCHLLSKIRNALDHNGFSGFFTNARIDTYLQKIDPLVETISRANAYVECGASGIFVPALKHDDEIRAVAVEVDAPLNILSFPGLTNAQRLQELGVKRFSFGNAFSDKVIEFLEKSAAQLYESQDTAPLYE